MVARRSGPARTHPRLLPGRGRRWSPLLAVPRGPLWPRGHAACFGGRRGGGQDRKDSQGGDDDQGREAGQGRAVPPAYLVAAWGVCVSSAAPAYAELDAISNFSFLEGGSHPGDLVIQAQSLGLT